MGYSGTFRFNQEKNDREPGKTLPLITRITRIFTDQK
jgi:hypothetical protein